MQIRLVKITVNETKSNKVLRVLQDNARLVDKLGWLFICRERILSRRALGEEMAKRDVRFASRSTRLAAPQARSATSRSFPDPAQSGCAGRPAPVAGRGPCADNAPGPSSRRAAR